MDTKSEFVVGDIVRWTTGCYTGDATPHFGYVADPVDYRESWCVTVVEFCFWDNQKLVTLPETSLERVSWVGDLGLPRGHELFLHGLKNAKYLSEETRRLLKLWIYVGTLLAEKAEVVVTFEVGDVVFWSSPGNIGGGHLGYVAWVWEDQSLLVVNLSDFHNQCLSLGPRTKYTKLGSVGNLGLPDFHKLLKLNTYFVKEDHKEKFRQWM